MDLPHWLLEHGEDAQFVLFFTALVLLGLLEALLPRRRRSRKRSERWPTNAALTLLTLLVLPLVPMSFIAAGFEAESRGLGLLNQVALPGWAVVVVTLLVRGFVSTGTHWLSHRPSNRQRNLWTVQLLEIAASHRVLELGFGPGLAIEACARRATTGLVVGIDHSETMRRVAAKRNARAVAEGRVLLLTASFDALPSLGGLFDRILAVNAVPFAEEPDSLLRELVSRLRPGGRIAVTFQSRRTDATSADSERGGADIAGALSRAGVTDVRVEVLRIEPVAAVCVLGTRAIHPVSNLRQQRLRTE